MKNNTTLETLYLVTGVILIVELLFLEIMPLWYSKYSWMVATCSFSLMIANEGRRYLKGRRVLKKKDSIKDVLYVIYLISALVLIIEMTILKFMPKPYIDYSLVLILSMFLCILLIEWSLYRKRRV